MDLRVFSGKFQLNKKLRVTILRRTDYLVQFVILEVKLLKTMKFLFLKVFVDFFEN